MDFEGTARFQVCRQLGAGGMGTVYEVFDRERGERVALKLLHLDADDADALLRFKNEFRELLDLQHRNLVSLGELVSDGGRWFFTMELIEGVDVLTWVAGDPERLRAALRQLGEALCALHAAGIVHRDVKPQNVLVDGAGRVVLLDFGLATRRDAGPSDPGIVGTPDYMAPEQAMAGPVGPAADWYAVGVLAYEALTTTVPFDGPPLEVLLRKQHEEPTPPSQRAAVPPRPRRDVPRAVGDRARPPADGGAAPGVARRRRGVAGRVRRRSGLAAGAVRRPGG